MVQTNQLLQIQVATNMKNILPWDPEAEIHDTKKTLVQLQFQAHYYWLYGKGTAHIMMGRQGLYSGNFLRCPSISAGIGLKLFCSWCLKLGSTQRPLPSTSGRYTIRWQSHVMFVRHMLVCPPKMLKITSQGVKGSVTRSMQSAMPVDHPGRLGSLTSQKPQPNQNHAEQDAALCLYLSSPANPVNEHTNAHSISQSLWIPLKLLLSKPSLTQMNCLMLFISHLKCDGVLFWLLTILTYTF